MARAIHGFEGHGAFVFFMFEEEHIVAIFFPVSGFFPKVAVEELGCFDFFVIGLRDTHADVIFEGSVELPPWRVPEDGTWGVILEVEEVHLGTDFSVVSPCGIFESLEVESEVFLVMPRGSVDSLELGIAGVSFPVCT